MISVIMPLYNEEKKDLIDSIDSILSQTEKKLELILILDNPSNIEIKKLMKYYEAIDNRIVLIFNNENLGVGLSLNKGIKIAKYDLIARLDADDISLLNRLEVQSNFLNTNPNIDMVSSNCIYIDEQGEILGEKGDIPTEPKTIKKILPVGSTIIHSSVMYRSKVVREIGGYRQLLSCQDYDLWLRMLDAGYCIASTNDKLVKYRIRKDSITGSQGLRLLLTERYVRNLHKERQKWNRDSFSFENYLSYLDNNNYNDTKSRDKYNKSTEYFEEFIFALKNKKFFRANRNIFLSLKKDSRIIIRMKNLIKYKIARKIYG